MNSTHNFTMPIDHFHNESRYEPHTNATFQQLYWLDTTNYVPGGPVIILAIGEDSATVDFEWLQKGLLHKIANATGGVAVLWAQRRVIGGDVVPSDQPYTTENLRFHSTEQAMADLAYFAQRVSFPGLEDRNLTASTTPWIILGGSYGGAISAFSRIQYPDLFWGGLSSSGVTVAIENNWQYFDVIRRYGPSECVKRQQELTNLMDNIYDSGNKTALSELFSGFNISDATEYPDFAKFITGPLNSWDQFWNFPPDPLTGPGTYCGFITSKANATVASAALETTAHSLLAYANKTATPNVTDLYYPLLNLFSYVQTKYSFCAGKTVSECLSLNSPGPFQWIECTEYGSFTTGYTPGRPGRPTALPLISRTLTLEYHLNQCHSIYNITYDPQLQRFNKYGGFNMSYPRLALSTGQLDYYRPLTPLAEFLEDGKPNPRVKDNGTDSNPQIVIEGGYHEWDFPGLLPNETDFHMPAVVASAQNREIEAVKLWLQEWNQTHKV
ncbi:hypothetical protein Z517_00728 [Fonsecaea pedrosoi CBS 271.37]|uniref:Uncharacterized protein n=1 Tax=Fonsecaea pedrosoi CBS 271.37 TaxID=1442368 RepID=A0A0D2GWE9_9EURO|nr:uncharacterized protein Z517_00728 [Fonsecaea pedrosoi CBS 271.37]KIW85338.1 hypothetical protein Z517_00728 [Fonsecaea pedrosoi CBS 271.37]